MTQEISQNALAKALAFPMDATVLRYAQEQDIPLEVAREHEKELKRYLALCAANPGKAYGMSAVIDDLWHIFICYTTDYHRFCKEVAGYYIHHQPTNNEDRTNGKAAKDYQALLEDYEKFFGEPAAVHIWPRLSHMHNLGSDAKCTGCKGCGVLEANGLVNCGGCNGCKGCTKTDESTQESDSFYTHT